MQGRPGGNRLDLVAHHLRAPHGLYPRVCGGDGGPGPRNCQPDLDLLRLLLHHLHVVVELRDVGKAGKVLLLLGQEVLDEVVQVPVLHQLQQPHVGHLVALEARALALLPVLLCLES